MMIDDDDDVDDTGDDNVAVLSAIVKINAAAELDNSAWMYDCLAADDAHIINLDSACREKYHRQLFKAKAAKLRVQFSHPLCAVFCVYSVFRYIYAEFAVCTLADVYNG